MPVVTYVGLDVLTGKAEQAVLQALAESGEHLLAACMAATPVDTGTLRASEHLTLSGTQAKVSTGGEADEYALYVHEGTSKMAARKYMEGPLLANAPLYAEAMRKAAAGEF